MDSLHDTQKIALTEIMKETQNAGGKKRTYNRQMVYADSHQGRVRPYNEDSFIFSLSDNAKMLLAAVADGIGGNEGGDLASRFTVEMLLRDFQKFQCECNDISTENVLKFMQDQLILVNSALCSLNLNYNVTRPMGTTIASALFTESAAVVAHAGDSRVYCLRDHKLMPLTRDHSVMNELMERGLITLEQAKVHPMAHVISRAMGIQDHPGADFSVFELKAGDRFLICSDGVMLHLSDEDIRRYMDEAQSPRDAVKKLITEALRGGGRDNTTAICVFV